MPQELLHGGDDAMRIVVLGSTGSIGVQTLEVVRSLQSGRYAGFFRVVGLAANENAELLAAQAREFGDAATSLRVRDGPDGARRLIEASDCTLVVSAVVGIAGLAPTLAAYRKGVVVALANKEALVAAGSLFGGREGGLLPVDSEHSAVWQCLGCPALPRVVDEQVRTVFLTASGGPFRQLSAEEASNKTPAEALRHPRWKMGPKITIDSATMVNKAFEMIEARWLFGIGNDRLAVLVHPQSLVHGMVEFADGSLMAHLSSPDMKGPIAAALCAAGFGAADAELGIGARRLSFKDAMSLEFSPACEERWEALALARWVIDESFATPASALGAVFNAANEVAVAAFLAGGLPFGRITQVCREVMDTMRHAQASTLEEVLAVDAQARAEASRRAVAPAGGVR